MQHIKLFLFSILLTAVPFQVHANASADTLVDLNRLNGGVKSFQVGECDTTFFELSSTAQVLLKKQLAAQAFPYRISVKCQSTEGVYVENQIEIWQSAEDRTIYVEANVIEMATGMRKDGKIWVVIAVVFTLFTGVVVYLIYLQRKLNAVEQLPS
ncbi:MAG: hypothetical protein O3C46_06985 [Bacteroidetes bacterium]|nr:hypothetical protein [Bacteroidota bacterium]